MDFTITDTAALAEAIAWAITGTAARPVQPWESAVGLRWEGGRLTLTAFDGEVAVTTSLPAAAEDPEVAEGWEAHVYGPTLARIGKMLPREPARFRDLPEEGRILVDCGPAHWRIRVAPDGGHVPGFRRPPVVGTCEAAHLQVALRAVGFAVASDLKVPAVFRHVYLTIGGPGMDLVAWASNRFQMHMMPCPWRPAEGIEAMVALVPKRVLDVIAGAAQGEVTVRLNGDLIGFDFAGRSLTSRLYDGVYPKVAAFLVQPAPVLVTEMDAGELAGALKRVAVANAGEAYPRVKLTLAGDLATVEAGVDDFAEETMIVKNRWAGLADGQDGGTVTVDFNADFLSTAVAAVPGAQVIAFRYTAPGKPVVITDSEDTEPYRGVLVPFSVPAAA